MLILRTAMHEYYWFAAQHVLYHACINRLCRAIALAAKDIKVTSKCSIKKAVLDARKYTTESTSGSGSLEGFLKLTDGIIYAIKIAPKSPKVEKVSIDSIPAAACISNSIAQCLSGSKIVKSLSYKETISWSTSWGGSKL